MPNIKCHKCGKKNISSDKAYYEMIDDDGKTEIKICQECHDKWKEGNLEGDIMTKPLENIGVNIARDVRTIRNIILVAFVLWIIGGFISLMNWAALS